jgi:hypothetical protein
MADAFSTFSSTVSDPSTLAVAVTAHDTNPLTDIPKAIFVGTTGNITMRGVGGGSDTVWKNIPSGTTIPFRAQYIRSTGTTAADILALY